MSGSRTDLQPFRFHLVISFVAMVVILVGGSGRWGRGFGGMIGWWCTGVVSSPPLESGRYFQPI